ncbi:MAG: hypothetical protein V1679_01245 [Candidatus Peregrinibacteria bacterium]
MKKIIYSLKAMTLLSSIKKSGILVMCGIVLMNSVYAETLPAKLPVGMRESAIKAEQDFKNGDITDCNKFLNTVYEVESLDLNIFLEQHFQNKGSTTSLINTALARFYQYAAELNRYFKIVEEKANAYTVMSVGFGADETATDWFTKYTACSKLRVSYYNMAKERMTAYIKNNAAQKKTVVFLEKLQSINTKLRDLNIKIAETYSYFLTFKNKLPFFVKVCQ